MKSNTRWAVASLVLATAVASLGIGVPNVALPELARAFDASFHSVEWVILAYQIASMVLGVGAGRFADIVGYRRVFLYGAALFTVTGLLCGAVPTLGWLIALRLLQGAGGVMMTATTLAMMRDVMPSTRVGTGMGLLGTAIAIGSASGPAIGGLAIAVWGWRAAFFVLAPAGLLAFVLVRCCVPAGHRPSPEDSTRFDWVGTLLLGTGVSAYSLAVTVGGSGFRALNAGLMIAAAVAAWLFVVSQSRVRAPLLRPAAWRDAGLRSSLLTNVCVAAVMMAFFVIAPFYLSGALGLNDIALGAAMAISPSISVVSGLTAGRVVDRVGATRMVTAGIAVMLVGCLGLAFLPSFWGLAGFIVPLFCFTPGYQLFLAANSTAVMTAAPSGERGVTSGMLSLSRGFGFITGTAVLGSVFASGASHIVTGDASAVAAGMRLMLLVGAGMLLVALVVSARRHPVAQGSDETLDAPRPGQVRKPRS